MTRLPRQSLVELRSISTFLQFDRAFKFK